MIFPTGIDGLDLILDGGIRHPDDGSFFMVIIGGPGTGKTNLALELSVRALNQMDASNKIVMSYSLDQKAAELHRKIENDFDFYGLPSSRRRLTGMVAHEPYAALVQAVKNDDTVHENILYLGSVNDSFDSPAFSDRIIETIDHDVAQFGQQHPSLGTALEPRLVTVDNIGLSAFDDSQSMRRGLSALRQSLGKRNIHGIFVIEAPDEARAMATTRAAEYAADLIVHLGYHEFGDAFKERSIEITKARHQFYYRGTHHFSIVGRRENQSLRGARGQKPAGIHIYPSVPTLLTWIHYHSTPASPPKEFIPLGFGDLEVQEHSANGLIGGPSGAADHLLLGLRFLTAEPDGYSLLISLKESEQQIEGLLERRSKQIAATDFKSKVLTLTFHPEYISSGKFLKDIHDFIEEEGRQDRPIRRALVSNLAQIDWAFPLLRDSNILVPWMVEYFKRRGITSMFLENLTEFRPHSLPPSSRLAAPLDNLMSSNADDSQLTLEMEYSLSLRGFEDSLVLHRPLS